MEKFRKVWSDEINEWLKTTTGMTPKDAYSLFLEKFKITDVTYVAFKIQRSKMGAAGVCTNPHLSRKSKPLYSEQIKKGYVRIKVAQPNVWIQKSKWVYQETHPYEDCSERSNYVFLDGDNRNFNPNNIERVPLKVMGVFNLMGGCEKGNPEITKLRILNAKLKLAILDKGEEMGLVAKVYSKGRKNAGRLFIKERNRKAKEGKEYPYDKIFTPETRRKISLSKMGNKNRLGMHNSEETKRKQSESAKKRGISEKTRLARLKKVMCIETGIIYQSQKEAEEKTGVPRKRISMSCHTSCKAYGFHWRLV